MNIVKCSKGHFYDADSYRNCPHCENNIFSEDMNTVHVSADKLYDEKTFALYGDNDGDNTLPADLFAPESAAYPGRDNNYYPEDDDTREPIVSWRSHANLLYANWLNYMVYQTTPYDLKEISG